MTTSHATPADRRYAIFLTMVHMGALATLLLIATLLFDLPSFVDGLPQGMLLVAIGMILVRKLRDDYVQDLWNTGTNAAFIAVAACFIFAPLAIDLGSDIAGNDFAWRDYKIAVQWPAAIGLVSFYAGFYWRMLGGSNEA